MQRHNYFGLSRIDLYRPFPIFLSLGIYCTGKSMYCHAVYHKEDMIIDMKIVRYGKR